MSLFWFHCRNQKRNSKEKANSRFLHASYDKKFLLIGGWIGVSQLLVSSTNGTLVPCSSVLIMVHLLLNLISA
jgi:hypothetical protein